MKFIHISSFIHRMTRRHKIVLAIIILLILAITTTIVLCFLVPRLGNKSKAEPLISTLTNKRTDANSASDAARVAASPSSGPLEYKAQDTYYNAGSKIPKFVYSTSEYRDERLIELNDQIISDLKAAKKITDDTTSYSINYFNDEDLAKIYFVKMADKATSSTDRTILENSHIATYTYSQKLKMNHLVKMRSLNTIIEY